MWPRPAHSVPRPARWSIWAPFPARAQESFPGECVQGGGGVRLELLDLLDRPLGVPVQGAVVVQARGGGHSEQRVTLRGGEHPEHRAQAEESQASPTRRPPAVPTRSCAGSRKNALRYRPCPTGSASPNRTLPGRVAVASLRVSACRSDRAPSANPCSLISRWPCPANRATAGTGGTPSPSRRTPTRSPSRGGAC